MIINVLFAKSFIALLTPWANKLRVWDDRQWSVTAKWPWLISMPVKLASLWSFVSSWTVGICVVMWMLYDVEAVEGILFDFDVVTTFRGSACLPRNPQSRDCSQTPTLSLTSSGSLCARCTVFVSVLKDGAFTLFHLFPKQYTLGVSGSFCTSRVLRCARHLVCKWKERSECIIK